MESKLVIYNTLTRQKERFEPLHAPNVGMYVCGPTVYGDPHLGHARPAITFDLVFRYLKHLGYKVRYVRNITDVGHLEHDADEGEDKIAKKARLEQLEPMEIAQYYTPMRRVISSNSSSSFSRSSTTVLLTRAMARSTSTLRLIIRNISMVSSLVVRWRTSRTPVATTLMA